ncbi:surface-adhesin E family protein [Undibacterium arcticum]
MGNYKDPVETGGAEKFSFKSYKDLSQYNCKTKTMAIVQEVLYAERDGAGATNHYNPPISKPNYLPPAPNSFGADILKFVCAYPLRKKIIFQKNNHQRRASRCPVSANQPEVPS